MKKQTQKKQPVSPIAKVGIVAAIIFTVLLVINGIAAYQTEKQNKLEAEKARQEQIRKEKEKPKFKKYNSNIGQESKPSASKNITKKQAGKYIRRDIAYGFELIQKEGLVSSNRLSTKHLSSQQNKKLLEHFDSVQTFNDFNQCVNVSTASGANYYGQNGQNKTIKTSKIGDKYTILGGSIDYTDSAYNQLLYDVNLKYSAGRMRIDNWFKISIDQETGVISKFALKGNKPNE